MSDRPTTEPRLFICDCCGEQHWLPEAAQGAAPLDVHTLAGWIEKYETEDWKHDPDFRDGTDRQVAENIARAILARLSQGAAPRAEGHHNHDGCNPYDEDHVAGKSLAAPRAEGLDVERLMKAMKAAGMWPSYPHWADPARETATKVAAEYIRLARPSDEREP